MPRSPRVLWSGSATFLLALACGLGACDSGDDAPAADADVSGPDAPPGSPDARPADAGPLVDPLVGIGQVTLVDDGYMFLEGPQWVPARGVLLFSDIPANKIYELTPGQPIEEFRPMSDNSNGLALDPDGRLLAAEHGLRRVSRTLANGTIETVAGTYMTKKLNSPNDVIARSDGTIYFTDPPYGIADGQRELDFIGVFRVPAAGGAPVAEWQGALDKRPNGIALSPDESTLYVADTDDGVVRAFAVAASGALSGERLVVASVPNPDGMAVDAAGNLFVTASDGVHVYEPDGTPWGTIATPGMQAANCAFGGADGKTLYITAREHLYQVQLVNPGLY